MTIGVKANSVEKVTFSVAGFSIVSATAPFFVRYGETKEKLKVFVGQNIGVKQGPILGEVTFINETASDIDVVTGEIGGGVASTVTPVPSDASGVTNVTNPITYNFWDTAGGGSSPFSGGASDILTLPINKPFRRVWNFFNASTFPSDNAVGLQFYLNSVVVYALLCRLKTSLIDVGMTMNSIWDANRTPPANAVFYKSGATGANYDILYPFDIYCVCDSVRFISSAGGVTGNIYAFLQVQSHDVKF